MLGTFDKEDLNRRMNGSIAALKGAPPSRLRLISQAGQLSDFHASRAWRLGFLTPRAHAPEFFRARSFSFSLWLIKMRFHSNRIRNFLNRF